MQEERVGMVDGTPMLIVTGANGQIAAVQNADQVQARIDALHAANAKDAEALAALTAEKCLADQQAAIDQATARLADLKAKLSDPKGFADFLAGLDKQVANLAAAKSRLDAGRCLAVAQARIAAQTAGRTKVINGLLDLKAQMDDAGGAEAAKPLAG